MECEYCKKKLTTLSSLNYHKKTNKSCLKIQLIEDKNKIQCEFCNKILSSKQTLKVHINNCKTKKEIKKRDSKIRK